MTVSTRAIAANTFARYPIHRVLPPGALKIYAALKYHGQRSTNDDLSKMLRSLREIPIRFHAIAIVATRAAFRSGFDEQAISALERMEKRFPESAEVAKLRAELDAYYGRFEQALQNAQHARQLAPANTGAAALAVKYAYNWLDAETANPIAVEALNRFPLSGPVLWAAAKACSSSDQFERLQKAWRDGITDTDERVALVRSVRQLATAAARARRVDVSIELFARAIGYLHEGTAPPVHNATRLAGRGAWQAITDIRQMLDDAKVPYFFAAGTALGFERVGRPLSSDGDIDVGIPEQHFDPEKLTALVAKNPRFLTDPHPLSEKVHMRHRGGSPIDFFRYYEKDGKMWHDGVFVSWWNAPFEIERRDFNGLSIPLPSQPDRYLTENYGDWRTPNSDFDSFTDEAPNCVVHWQDHHQLHYMRRAFKEMINHNRVAAAAELRQADHKELADKVERD